MPLFPSLSQALAFLVLCTAAYYAFARADLTRPLWSRYPGFLDRMARCPACSGFWIGAALGLALALALPDDTAPAKLVLAAVLGAAWGTVVTPLGTWALVSALAATTIPDEPPGPPPPAG